MTQPAEAKGGLHMQQTDRSAHQAISDKATHVHMEPEIMD